MVSIEFGALCDPITEQLKKQGIAVPEKDAERFQKLADAITYLHLNRIITGSVRDNAHQKLMKEIVKVLEGLA